MRDLVSLSEQLESGIVSKFGPSFGIKRTKVGASAKRSVFVVQRKTLLLAVLLIIALGVLGSVAAAYSNVKVTISRSDDQSPNGLQRAVLAKQLKLELADRLARESTEGLSRRQRYCDPDM